VSSVVSHLIIVEACPENQPRLAYAVNIIREQAGVEPNCYETDLGGWRQWAIELGDLAEEVEAKVLHALPGGQKDGMRPNLWRPAMAPIADTAGDMLAATALPWEPGEQERCKPPSA
jgi:hypothetical protein